MCVNCARHSMCIPNAGVLYKMYVCQAVGQQASRPAGNVRREAANIRLAGMNSVAAVSTYNSFIYSQMIVQYSFNIFNKFSPQYHTPLML